MFGLAIELGTGPSDLTQSCNGAVHSSQQEKLSGIVARGRDIESRSFCLMHTVPGTSTLSPRLLKQEHHYLGRAKPTPSSPHKEISRCTTSPVWEIKFYNLPKPLHSARLHSSWKQDREHQLKTDLKHRLKLSHSPDIYT